MTESDDRVDDGTAESVVQAEVAESETTEQAQAEIREECPEDVVPGGAERATDWPRVAAYGVMPGLVLVLAMAAGFSKWQDDSARSSAIARAESVTVAKDSTIALLSYQPDTVENNVAAAEGRLTAPFKDAYAKLTHDVVIPGAKKQHVAVTVSVPAQASVSATPEHAVALLFVNQSAVVGTDPPIDTESSIRVTLKKVDGRWLISGFDPL